ncbi:MAG: phosphatase PAP2 family protein, partial [Candidatus Thermofonsia bacterium]
WTGLFLLWAVLVSLARVALARHYLTDVAAGFVLGVIVGLVGTAVF